MIEIHYTVELLRNKDEGKSVAFIENIPEDSTIPALENGPISSSSIDFLIPFSSSPHVVGPSEKESRHNLPNPEIEPTFDALIAEEAAELNKLGVSIHKLSSFNDPPDYRADVNNSLNVITNLMFNYFRKSEA